MISLFRELRSCKLYAALPQKLDQFKFSENKVYLKKTN